MAASDGEGNRRWLSGLALNWSAVWRDTERLAAGIGLILPIIICTCKEQTDQQGWRRCKQELHMLVKNSCQDVAP